MEVRIDYVIKQRVVVFSGICVVIYVYIVLGGSSDMFSSRMGRLFDPVVCYEVYSELTIASVFSPYRIERLYQQSSPYPSLHDVLHNFTTQVIYHPLNSYISTLNSNSSGCDMEIYTYESFAMQSVLVNRYIKIAAGVIIPPSDSPSSFYVQSQVKQHLREITNYLNQASVFFNNKFEIFAHIQMLMQKISSLQPFMNDIRIPDGPPI
jgi:hypothetical protein